MPGPGGGQRIIDYTRASWIYTFTKPELIEILEQLELAYEESLSIDELRKILRTHVTEENKRRERLHEDKNSQSSENENVNKKTKIIHTMAGESTGTKLEFQLGKDDWETYTESLQLYFVANDVKTEKQAAVLLTKISADTYKLVRDLCAPDKPSTKSFDELVKLVNDHLNPKPSETMERCKFYQAHQSATESVAEFTARLKSLSLNCNFADAKIALRDQLVCGLKDHATKKALFREDKLTYDSAYKIAAAMEEAEKNASTTDKISTGTASNAASVNVVQSNSHASEEKKRNQASTRGRGAYSGGRGRGQRYNNNTTRNGGNKTSHNNTHQSSKQSSCYGCGKANHWARDCYHRFSTCDSCKRKGHLAAACRSQKAAVQHLERESTSGDQQREEAVYDFLMVDDNEDESTSGMRNAASDNVKTEPMFLNVMINGKKIDMEIDSGSYVAIISKSDKNKYFPEVKITRKAPALNAYGKVPLESEGVLENLKVKLGNREETLTMRVMTNDGPTLIGRQWLKVFGLWPLPLNLLNNGNDCNKIDVNDVTKQLPEKYPKLFGPGPGLYNKGKLRLVLEEDAQPVALKARHLPFALTSKVEDEINRLVKLGHLEKVDVSEWATPIVPVIKSNGSVRICGNFKLTVNPNLVRDRHPIPLIDEIFLALRNGKSFSQIDLEHAYMQIPVEENSRDCLTITTHKGLYRYTKMTEGIASGPGDFQRKIEQCLAGIDGAIPYLDNIFCSGKTDEDHLKTLHAVCKRLEEYGFKVNINKCDFFKEKLDILGFVINKDGLHKSRTKVKAMIKAPTPVDKKQLDSFLGLVTYYARFLPDRATQLQPLYECAKEDKLVWTKECEKAFEWVKKELVSPCVLAHFDPNEEIVLACDASSYGLAAILSHRYRDGTEKPNAYASKIIPEKELNRAIIDKEASAIVFGFKKFYNYIFGKEITLRTDHKPLVFIFGPKQEIPLTTASRLQRWAYFLSRFTYKIEYIKSEHNGNCDALSRLSVKDSTRIFNNEYISINYAEESFETLNAVEFADETKRDKMLSSIVRYLKGTWPNASELNEYEKIFYAKRDELVVEKGCIMWGYRVVAPESAQKCVLNELHASHLGIVKMTMLARSYVWWPNIDKDIENIAASCKVCVQERKKPASVPLTPWPFPDRCWSRIHTDFLGPFHGHMFMLIIDAYSKWPEIIDMQKCTQAPRVIEEFKKVLVRFGLPRHLVSDNGTQYTSTEFQGFCKSNGIKHSFSAPHHPATNGAAENFVQTFKDKVDKIVKSGKSLEYAINLFLFDYRATEHCTTRRTPAYMMYKRELRTRFDLLRPSVSGDVQSKQLAQVASKKGSRNIDLQIGDVVMVDDFSVRSNKRRKGQIIKKLSSVTFEVKVESGKVWKRHVDQIVRFMAPIEDETTSIVTPVQEPEKVLRRSNRLRERN